MQHDDLGRGRWLLLSHRKVPITIEDHDVGNGVQISGKAQNAENGCHQIPIPSHSI